MNVMTMKVAFYQIGILAFITLIAVSGSHAQTPAKGLADKAKGQKSGAHQQAVEAAKHDAEKRETTKHGTAEHGTVGKSQSPGFDKIEAEREKIWNSPEMLTARAWLETYFERSAKITDEQARKYMDGLRTMYPDQMKLWLVKFQADRKSRKQHSATARQARQKTIAMRQTAPQVGGFQNPYAGRRVASSGQPVGNVRQTFGGGTHPYAQRQPVQKPFSSPQYQNARRPLVTSEEVARWEILRGLGFGIPN